MIHEISRNLVYKSVSAWETTPGLIPEYYQQYALYPHYTYGKSRAKSKNPVNFIISY
jgi:hypothetical protein